MKRHKKKLNTHIYVSLLVVIIAGIILAITFLVRSTPQFSKPKIIPIITEMYEESPAHPESKPKPLPQGNWPQEIVHGNTAKKQVIFTFDGGSTDVSGQKILDVLEKHHVKGTFFLTGKFVETNPDLVRKMVAGGHEVFNHTYNHPDLTTVSSAKIKDELLKMDQVLLNIAHISTKPYFRPPYGSRNAAVLSAAGQAGYRSVYWTTDALDWKVGISEQEVKNKILANLIPGAIYLMHIGDAITGNILDEMLTTIESKGYTAVSLTQGIK